MVNRPSYSMLGQSGAIAEVLNEARFVSATDFNVLLTGESGVGKGVLAQFIHENSPRRQRKMLTRKCAAVVQSRLETDLFGHVPGSIADAHTDRTGLFGRADGSTLFLDEVGELGRRLQTRLLGVIENGHNVRLISSTSRDLLERTPEQAFCVDLYYRLNVVHLQIPPLRARPEDISFLMGNCLKARSEDFRLPLCELHPFALAKLEHYRWPGNIRELSDVAEHLALVHAGRVVAVDQLPQTILEQRGPAQPIGDALDRTSVTDPVATACYENSRLGFS